MQHDSLTLADIGNDGLPLWHVYAEKRGYRYYLGSAVNASDRGKLIAEYKTAVPGLCVYVTDKNDNTCIHFAYPSLDELRK